MPPGRCSSSAVTSRPRSTRSRARGRVVGRSTRHSATSARSSPSWSTSRSRVTSMRSQSSIETGYRRCARCPIPVGDSECWPPRGDRSSSDGQPMTRSSAAPPRPIRTSPRSGTSARSSGLRAARVPADRGRCDGPPRRPGRRDGGRHSVRRRQPRDVPPPCRRSWLERRGAAVVWRDARASAPRPGLAASRRVRAGRVDAADGRLGISILTADVPGRGESSATAVSSRTATSTASSSSRPCASPASATSRSRPGGGRRCGEAVRRHPCGVLASVPGHERVREPAVPGLSRPQGGQRHRRRVAIERVQLVSVIAIPAVELPERPSRAPSRPGIALHAAASGRGLRADQCAMQAPKTASRSAKWR